MHTERAGLLWCGEVLHRNESDALLLTLHSSPSRAKGTPTFSVSGPKIEKHHPTGRGTSEQKLIESR